MNGTTTFALKPSLDLEMDFDFTPGTPGKLDGHPDSWYPAENPDYEIGEIRVYHNKQWHKVPYWLWEIMNFNYEDALIEAVHQWVEIP